MSNDQTYSVQEQALSAEELTAFYDALKARTLPPSERPIHARPFLGRETPEHQKGFISDGFFFRGRFGITLRNAKTGAVEWHHEQDNLMTDIARYLFWDGGFTSMQIGFVPSKETPTVARSSLPCDPLNNTNTGYAFFSGNLSAGTVTPATYTRQYSYNFTTTPVATRTLGSVVWAFYTPGINLYMGPEHIAAYALLTPPKTQLTTQTLEVVYKISMNPIY